MEKSESIKELALALCNFQAKVANVSKDGNNPFFKSKYATLGNILDVIRQPLSECDLSFSQVPTGQHELTTIIMHSSGEWIMGTYNMPPTKNDPQGVGSAITYQKRYALAAMLGLNTDDDDDGNGASEKPEAKTKKEQEQLDLKAKAKINAIAQMEAAKTLAEMINVWTTWKTFQTDPDFIKVKEDKKQSFNTTA